MKVESSIQPNHLTNTTRPSILDGISNSKNKDVSLTDDTNNGLNLDLTPIKAQQILKEIAQDSSKVIFSSHADEQMISRSITRTQVFRCLKTGRIFEGPYRDIRHGTWKMNIEVFTAGETIKVVVALDDKGNGSYAIVITAFNG